MLGGVGRPAARRFHSVFNDQPHVLATALALMTSSALLTFPTQSGGLVFGYPRPMESWLIESTAGRESGQISGRILVEYSGTRGITWGRSGQKPKEN